MGLGPYANDVLDIVELVESGVILQEPRPPLGPGLKVIHDMARVGDYIHAHPDLPEGFEGPEPDLPEGKCWDWRELLDFAGEPDTRFEYYDLRDEMLNSVPGLLEKIGELVDGRINEALNRQLGGKYTDRDILWIVGTFDFIIFCRAAFGRTKPFIERLVEIYRLCGHPCGWVGPYPEGRLVAYFSPEDDT